MKGKRARTKIVCTIGPASKSKDILSRMIDAGMDVVRINLSHEDHKSAKETFELIRSVDNTIPILFDLQGPKIRIGDLKEPVELMQGDELIISTDDFVGDSTRVSISHKELPQDVKPGDVIAINDGIVRLRVKEIRDNEVLTIVTHGGPISSRKGVNIPGIKISCKVPTEEDTRDVEFVAGLEPDFFALSFVTERDDLVRLRYLLEANGLNNVRIISKIEHRLAVEHFDEILTESDGIMIARGDLGIEVPIEEVPILQRELIHRANVWAKPVIVATHMLESMTKETVPTRAEVSDVAHAVLDRADAVMLSGETAIGNNPVGTVEMMSRIIRKAEEVLPARDPIEITSPDKKIVEIIGNLVYGAVCLIPDKIDGIITATRSGYTARWISKFRPATSIYAVTPSLQVLRKLRLLWGVEPIQFEHDIDNVDDLVQESVRIVLKKGFISREKDIVFTSGVRHIPGRTNVMGVFHIKDVV